MSQETVRLAFPDASDPPDMKISFGLPFQEACAKHVRDTFRAKRAYVVASKTLSEKTKFLQQLQDALSENLVGTWIGIPNHTPADSLIPIIHDIRARNADCLITLGGGSISDGVKLINLALANDVQTLDDLYQLPRIGGTLQAVRGHATNGPQLPLILIPISLSGGEYTKYAGVTHPTTHFKDQFTHAAMFASLLILDPQLTMNTPLSMWFSSGVRAIDHCVEGFLSINATAEGDAAARRGLTQLVTGLLQTVDRPDDLKARLRCQLGCNLSMTLILLGILKGASHGVGHQLGALGVGHGDTSCIMLPAVCKYNAAVNGDKQAELRLFLLEQEPVQRLVHKGVLSVHGDLGDVLRAIFNAMGRPQTLKDVNFPVEQLNTLAQHCLDEVYVKSNPRPIKTTSDVMQLMDMVRG